MQVKLISVTPNAVDLLLFTKNTRLEMTPSTMDVIARMSPDAKLEALNYMAETIPSSWEFVDYVFSVTDVSRAYTHQQVRTRSASYAQQTLRVLDLRAGFDYVYTERNLANPKAVQEIDFALAAIDLCYRRLIEMGQPVEDARGILPTNVSTNIVCKFNLRTMSELAKSRSGGRTQGEYRNVINGMLDEILLVHPWARPFLFPKPRDYFTELEAFAEQEYGGDLLKKGRLLKIVDKMRKEA